MTNTIDTIIRLIKIWNPYVSMADSCPTSSAVPRDEMMRYEPKYSTTAMLTYRQNCIIGLFSARIFSACVKSAQTSSAARANFCFSYSSRTNDLTTRIPLTFSWMESFSLSYLRNTRRNSGITVRATAYSPSASSGTSAINTNARRPPITNDMVSAKISISGARTAIRIIIMNAICTLVISVVSRVTSDEVENRSIFSNEKSCTR